MPGDLLELPVIDDQFVFGEIARVSREAPVLILDYDSTEIVPGGAGNAAANVAALGGAPTSIGVAGHDDAGKRLWPGLAQLYPPRADQPLQRELIDRFLYVQANEAARCVEEGIVRSVADANVGSILGWGFAPFTGGVLQFINTVGPAAFAERARELAARHGGRFAPAQIVVRLATQDARFADQV